MTFAEILKRADERATAEQEKRYRRMVERNVKAFGLGNPEFTPAEARSLEWLAGMVSEPEHWARIFEKIRKAGQ